MTLLAIESATDTVGVALFRDDGGSAERVHEGGRTHAELLAPAIEEVCAVSGCTVGDIDAIAVDVGPGLFTGLRVGVATAKALGQSLGIGVLGVSSLDILAAAVVDRVAASLSGVRRRLPVRPGARIPRNPRIGGGEAGR
jgi:tRNA threonylcarbamoyladenosine biosynthesis protein TsaB